MRKNGSENPAGIVNNSVAQVDPGCTHLETGEPVKCLLRASESAELLDPSLYRPRQPSAAPPVVNLVVPCFNEQDVLPETASRLSKLLGEMKNSGRIAEASSIYFVDDGSKDSTWALIYDFANHHNDICGIKLTRNRGHQNALLCGLMSVAGDALISLDSDLQDDLSIIPAMIDAYRDGSEIVYAVRRRRAEDTFFKRFTAESYYRLLLAMGVKIVFNHADYRLLGRRALESLRNYREVHLFLRGLVPQLGYSSTTIEYDRAERFAGESKYPIRKMLAFAWQGISSFSPAPLRIITGVGVIVSVTSVGMAIWALLVRLLGDAAVPGWASIVIPTYFLGGIQLMSLGIIGEYLAKVYEASKQRPRYDVQEVVGAWKGKA